MNKNQVKRVIQSIFKAKNLKGRFQEIWKFLPLFGVFGWTPIFSWFTLLIYNGKYSTFFLDFLAHVIYKKNQVSRSINSQVVKDFEFFDLL